MNFDCDIVVVGAGPVGSTIAYYLSLNGLSVTIIEKKKQIGYPLQCAGIISKNVHSLNEVPNDIIINSVKGAFLHSQNHILNVQKDNDVAIVIDRIKYDEFLLNRAIKSGVNLQNKKAIDFDVSKGITTFQDQSKIKSKIIIGCDGYNSTLSMHIQNKQEYFNASQMLVEITKDNMNLFRKSNKETDNYVDTYLIEEILPGFLWIIPTNDDLYRIGLFSNHSHKKQNDILINFLNNNFQYGIKEKYKGFIPKFNENNQLVKNRAILIGDAGCQIKPTSGGGLLIAFDACKIACNYVLKAIETDNIDFLKKYQDEFFKKYSKEFSYQFKVQKTLNMLSNEDIDYLFLKLKTHNGEELISKYGDMDNQSILVKEFIKRGLIFKIIPSFLFKKVRKIFNFR